MKIRVFLNRHSGTMRSLGIEAAERVIIPELERAGHAVTVEGVTGESLAQRLDAVVAEAKAGGGPKAVVIGGGDGSVSTAAGRLAGTGVALGVLPLGTMNLFARSLGMPIDFEEAVRTLATAEPRPADIAEVNGRLFIHQLGFGVQPHMARVRRRALVGGKAGKLFATARALFTVFRRPRVMRLTLVEDGTETPVAATGLVVSNSLYGAGHLPFADDPADGRLGVYVCTSRAFGDLLQLTTAVVRGTWRDDPRISVTSATDLVIKGRSSTLAVTVDGELERVDLPARVMKRPGALTVLAAPRG
ncbi:diacylglycerol kinase family protein [Chthonobacter rhizosphaerae]|uniref:diacylglycerol kinase family protein n=1 Tax=Chthonobacter rhizosphaerae TaxID=2735553 RepID=UPI0015EEAD29